MTSTHDRSRYNKRPFVETGLPGTVCAAGWDSIASRLLPHLASSTALLAVECYPGVFEADLARDLAARLPGTSIVFAHEGLRSPTELTDLFARDLTDDPVFGRVSGARLLEFFDPAKLGQLQQRIRDREGRVLVLGTGASLLAPTADCLVYADMARWELQQRQRRNEIPNLGLDNLDARAAAKYKRAFFLDWRVADAHKLAVLPLAHFILDTNTPAAPVMVDGPTLRRALAAALTAPLRLVPFFDPGPWGGQWMREHFDLSPEPPNFAWCFDCVPEENSVLLRFGDCLFELPSQDLVLFHPEALMGEAVHARFGLDFPIRFDLLDTMGGGNLSFQVHPLTEYIQSAFGMNYTQDESYYLLDAGPDATVYLGLLPSVDPARMEADLRQAQTSGHFPVETYANRFPARKHDHFLIPAGTPHCSGANSMVLEISATPFIFTFKLWDWERLGLDGRPRPVHLDHGLRNIQWSRDTAWVTRELVNTVTPVARGEGWEEERTGLHAREFLETRRHWFTRVVPHQTGGTVNVLNLIEGSAALVESPTGAFAPFPVHYAETFIVPAAVDSYTIRPLVAGERCGTIKAFVRSGVASSETRGTSAKPSEIRS